MLGGFRGLFKGGEDSSAIAESRPAGWRVVPAGWRVVLGRRRVVLRSRALIFFESTRARLGQDVVFVRKGHVLTRGGAASIKDDSLRCQGDSFARRRYRLSSEEGSPRRKERRPAAGARRFLLRSVSVHARKGCLLRRDESLFVGTSRGRAGRGVRGAGESAGGGESARGRGGTSRSCSRMSRPRAGTSRRRAGTDRRGGRTTRRSSSYRGGAACCARGASGRTAETLNL